MPSQKIMMPTIILGFAIFSMFFGAGNVIYPMQVGVEAVDGEWVALLGFLITGVGAPLLGLYAILLTEGDLFRFFSDSNKLLTALWIGILVLALGPFGATPRCVLLSYQALKAIIPSLSLIGYTIGLGVILTAVVLRKFTAIHILGKFLSPLLITLLLTIMVVSISPESLSQAFATKDATESLLIGLQEGYQTMDLLAALLFAVTIYQITKRHNLDVAATRKLYLYAMFLGGALLGAVYLGLGLAASSHTELLSNISKDLFLNTLSYATLSTYGGTIACLVVFLACITTIIALIVTCADCTLQWFEKAYAVKSKRFEPITLIVFLMLTMFAANLGFDSISGIINVVVHITYPILIALAIIRILQRHTPFHVPQKFVNGMSFLAMGYQSITWMIFY